MKDKISVIVPAFNEAKYIEKTLELLKNNTINFELIVVCDSCVDKTKEISLKYTDLVFEVNFKNVSKVRNFGVEKSSGDILVFLDADTLVSKNYLLEIINSISKFDYGCARWISDSGSFFGRYIAWITNIYNKENIGGNFFVKKDLFNKVRGFDENMQRGEDTDFGERLKKHGARYGFLENCFIIPSERRYKKYGYLYMIIMTGISGLVYKFFRKFYIKKIASKFYD